MDFDLQNAFAHLHDRFDRIEDNVKEVRDKTVANTTHLEALVGNGQPGEIHKIQNRLAELEEYKNKSVGYTAAVSAIIAFLGFAAHFLWDALKGVRH